MRSSSKALIALALLGGVLLLYDCVPTTRWDESFPLTVTLEPAEPETISVSPDPKTRKPAASSSLPRRRCSTVSNALPTMSAMPSISQSKPRSWADGVNVPAIPSRAPITSPDAASVRRRWSLIHRSVGQKRYECVHGLETVSGMT